MVKQVEFNNRVLFLGFGAVAQCALPIFVRQVRMPLKDITVMDFEEQVLPKVKPWVSKSVRFVAKRVTRENMGALLGKYLKAGDLLIDLAWNIDCCEILQWCHDRGIRYVNTSVELWDPYSKVNKQPTEKTLYWRHMNIRRMVSGWKYPGPTAVIEHGANPGLISHWTKWGLSDIAERMLDDGKARGAKAERIRDYLKSGRFNYLAMELGVKVIHCSERDTQISDQPKEMDEFVNTWSIEGFREEGTTTAEMGWGTHEKQLPALAYQHKQGPRNQICLARMGINVHVRSWVPYWPIEGMVVRHGEAFTISDRLTVWKSGKAVYRPTVHYAYYPCDAAVVSLHELRCRDYELQPKLRIMNDEITKGADVLGALIMGHPYNSWWTGSTLTIGESRKLVPHQNATTMQVACSVVAASLWMMENPACGVKVPDDLPHEFVLGAANRYLGKSLSLPSDWTPLKGRLNVFKGWNKLDLDLRDPWQFKNFLVTVHD